MKNEPCPPENALAEYVRCHVSEDQAEVISEHIAICDRCEETVVGLEQNADTTLGILREAPAAFPFQDEPELKRGVLAVKQRPPEPPSSNAELSPVPQLEQLRDYRIVEKIGEGGMGAVYRAIHTRLNKTVALKVLSNSRLRDESAVSRFQREMSIVGRLQHPNIVQAHDAGEEAGQHFLVMEYVDGTDLSDILRQCGPLPIGAACEVIAQAAGGLQYAYENGLVHRDIKPSNLMLALSKDQKTHLGPAVVVKILDLGLARLQSDDKDHTPELTVDGQVMGTLDYMAPEQGGDSHSVDIRADIYSLGATLYKLLTGEVLFHADRHRSVIQKLTALATETAPSVQLSRPDVPESLANVIARMLAKRPQDRFATPGEVVSALQPYRSAAGLPALLGMPDLITEEVVPGTTVFVAPDDQPPRRRFTLAWAVKWFCGAAVLLAAVIVISTKEGTVEIESTDGPLPADIKVSVTRDGDSDVEILQADNKWRVSVAGGQIQLKLQGGTDQFELVDDTLTVSRFGKTVVKLRRIPASRMVAKVEEPKPAPGKPEPVKPGSTQPDKAKPQPVSPAAVPRIAVREKPFIVTRKGQSTGEYSSLYGALSAVSGDDVIEVHANGPVPLRTPEAVAKPLHLRAGKGYRPLLVVKQGIAMQAGLVIEDCDVDQRVAGFGMNGGRFPDPWQFRRCRFWGGGFGYFNAPQLVMEDCIFDTEHGFMLVPTEPTEITVTNCAVRTSRCFLQVEGAQPVPVKIDLKANTFRFSTNGSLLHIRPADKVTATVDAVGNVFEFQFGGTVAGIMPSSQWRGQIDWRGQDNVFDGDWYREWAKDGTITVGLETWNKHWKQPEQNSIVINSLRFAGERTGDWPEAGRIAGIRTAVEQIKTEHQLPELGPDWNLIGVGDSYVRALATLGREVPSDRLRPEVHPDGPLVIIRNDIEFKGYLTLKAAMEAAETGDVIEIRTDDPIPAYWAPGTPRRLTLRAAPGYSPIINGDVYLGEERLIVEGLTFRGTLSTSGIPAWSWKGEGPPFPGKGCFERITNCVFLGPDPLHVWGWFIGEGDQVPEITNCLLGWVGAGIQGGKKIHIKNSVLANAWISVETTKEPGHLELSNCVLWTPDLGTVPYASAVQMQSPLAIASRNSVFTSPDALVGAWDISKHFRGWTGTRNVYIRPGSFFISSPHGTGATSTLDEVQKTQKTDADSIELLPLSFDAANWRIWRERSTDYQPLKKGVDIGADIDRLSKAITASVTVRKSK